MDLIALGPLELRHDGKACDLGPPKVRRVLAVLLHARGKPVSMETLVSRVWEESEPSDNAVGTMRTYLSRLRACLKTVGAEKRLPNHTAGGYRLIVAPGEVDLLRFEQYRDRARDAAARGDAETAIRLFRDAEAQWQGEPLAEFTSEWAESVRARLREDLRRVKEQRFGLALERGEHSDLIGELQELVAQKPTAQRAVEFLMLALYRSGRHADALKVYRDTYQRFDEKYGTLPDARLQQLNQRMIEQDPALDLPSAPSPGPSPGPVPEPRPARASDSASDSASASASARTEPRPSSPRTGGLPPGTRDFIGRASELAALLADFDPSTDGDQAAAPPVCVLYGMAGIGKTATAVRAARRMADRFPDGVHYIDLRGDTDESRCDPHEALGVLLRNSGAVTKLPDSLDERTARWRDWAARHGALIVLDNARSARQVAPLLPATPSCRVVVTSRYLLSELDGTHDIPLDTLSTNEAMELFRRIAGASRTADPETLRRVVDTCGRHPLALKLVAGRYRHRATWDLEHLHERLVQSHDPLTEFAPGLAEAFQVSYSELTADARQLLRRMALHTGPAVTLGGASALLGTSVPAARPAVEALQDAHLLAEEAPDRFSLHDLVRSFALRACRRDEPEAACRSATRRLLAYYLHSADHADRLAHPRRRRLRVLAGPGDLPVHAEEFADADEASGWLELERPNLLAAARTAAAEAPSCAAAFAHVLAASLKLWGAWKTAAQMHATAVGVLREGMNRRGLAQALTEGADVHAKGSPQEALRYATEALRVYGELNDTEGCADALLQLARVQHAVGEGRLCLQNLSRALHRYREAGNRRGEAEVLKVRGVTLHRAGEYEEAAACIHAVHLIYRELGDLHGQVHSLNNIGEIHRLAGRLTEARAHFEEALSLVQRTGGRQERASLYINLGKVHQASGEKDRALAYLQQALHSYRMSDDALGEANTLSSLGAVYASSDRTNEALWHYTRAGQLARRIGNPEEEQSALIGIGSVQRKSGRYDLAEQHFRKALELARRAGIRLGVAEALDGLAQVAMVTKGRDAAAEAADEAARLYEELGQPDRAQELRVRHMSRGVTGS